jgi:hypothetical protein
MGLLQQPTVIRPNRQTAVTVVHGHGQILHQLLKPFPLTFLKTAATCHES